MISQSQLAKSTEQNYVSKGTHIELKNPTDADLGLPVPSQADVEEEEVERPEEMLDELPLSDDEEEGEADDAV